MSGEFRDLKPGRETDALIAVLFFDWKWVKTRQLGGKWLAVLAPGDWTKTRSRMFSPEYSKPGTAEDPRYDDWDQVPWYEGDDADLRHGRYIGFPHFSVSDGDALALVERLTADESLRHPLYFKLTYRWWYEEDRLKDPEYRFIAQASFDWKETGDRHPLYVGRADTIAFAICLAALEYHRIEEK